MLTSLILAVALAATPATRPAVVIPVPATAEAYLTLQKNRDALAKQVAAMTAKLEAMDEALQKADGRAKALKWPKIAPDGEHFNFGRLEMVGKRMVYFHGGVKASTKDGPLPLARMTQTTKVLCADKSVVVHSENCIPVGKSTTEIHTGGMRTDSIDKAGGAVNTYVTITLDGKTIYEDIAKPADASCLSSDETGKPWWDR